MIDLAKYTRFEVDIIPEELKQVPQWVAWKPVERKRKNGTVKVDKIPINANTGDKASSTDPDTWSDFDTAVQFAQASGLGVGFVLSDAGPFVGVDLDDCIRDDQSIDDPSITVDALVRYDTALTIVDELSSYTEISPSGAGLRIIVRGELPDGRRSRGGVEMYTAGRFLTMTGRHVAGTPRTIADNSNGLKNVHKQFLEVSKASRAVKPANVDPAPTVAPTDQFEQVSDALKRFKAWRADDYGEWVRIGHAIKHHFGDAGFQLWDEWSKQSAKYDPDDARRRWDKLSSTGHLDIGTVFAVAREDDPGYRPPAVDIMSRLTFNGEAPAAVQDDNFLVSEPQDDYGNANCVMRVHGQRFRYTGKFEWLEWIGTHWNPSEVAEARARLAVRDILYQRRLAITENDKGGTQSTAAVRPNTSKITAALAQFRDLVTVDGDEFDDVPHLLNCANGVVDLRTGDLVSHDPSNRFTYCIPTEYVPGAPAELWVKTILDVLEGDHERAGYLKRSMGYSATGETREECLFYLSGKHGRNGKGTVVNTMLDVLGMPLAQATSFSSFSSRYNDPQGFLLAPLHNARMVAASESSKSTSLNEATVKMVTGRDSFQVAFKNKTPFMMTPAFKVWLMSNHPIRGDTDDNAFWYRFRLIEFNKTFQGSEDKLLKTNLLQSDSRVGILAWLVHGAMQWYERGLGEPQSIFDAVKRHRDEHDDALRFVNDVLDTGVGVRLDDVYQAYKIWADDNGVKAWSKAFLSRKLNAKGIETTRVGRHPDQYQLVSGYKLQDDYSSKVVKTP